jgi:hypothetical protein
MLASARHGAPQWSASERPPCSEAPQTMHRLIPGAIIVLPLLCDPSAAQPLRRTSPVRGVFRISLETCSAPSCSSECSDPRIYRRRHCSGHIPNIRPPKGSEPQLEMPTARRLHAVETSLELLDFAGFDPLARFTSERSLIRNHPRPTFPLSVDRSDRVRVALEKGERYLGYVHSGASLMRRSGSQPVASW